MSQPAPTAVNRTLIRKPNNELRPREYLTQDEIAQLMAAAKKRARNKINGHRDATMILVAASHGLRVTELCHLRWSQITFDEGNINITRLKGSKGGLHPLRGTELRALRQLKRDPNPPFVFINEQGNPVSASGFRKRCAGSAIKPPSPSLFTRTCSNISRVII
ncbi:MAG: tyrosine-type recombinase/integrase [Candidatus Competibacteraceae bacterium]